MTDLSDYRFDVVELRSDDGGGFLVTFPDIPGVIGIGENEAEAIADGQQALFACFDALKAVDREPPVVASAATGRSVAPLA
jgi:predicted RNase H-like HicB family nuclease